MLYLPASLVRTVVSVTPKGINKLSQFPVRLGVRAEISLSAGSLLLFKLFGVFVKPLLVPSVVNIFVFLCFFLIKMLVLLKSFWIFLKSALCNQN